MATLYSVSLTRAGDVAVANDVLIHFPNTASRNELLDRVAVRRGYSDKLSDGSTNHVTKAQFVLDALRQFLNDELRASIIKEYHENTKTGIDADITAKLP